MKIRFWGVRGSTPSPGPKTVRYGGNTTCIEVRSDEGELIIIDAGTGIAALSQALLREIPKMANIFITHTHWDHIQGLPFFLPFFIPGNRVKLHGPFDIITGQGVQQVMEVQMQYSYFPIREAELRAAIEYQTLEIGESVTVGDAMVSSTLLNHPVADFGYRVNCNGKSMFFTGDHEPWYNIYDPGDESYDEFQTMIDEKQKGMDDFLLGVDVLIVDCSYTTAEYPAKRGWGHGTFAGAIELARRVGAKQLVCTHHEPTRDDDELERVFDEVLQQYPLKPGDPKILLSYEGLEINL
ncbi:MAG: MBL fold metallo-hydrolase [Georgfuchsia sp.]